MADIETLAKKAARYTIWRRVMQDLGDQRFTQSRFLYLAGAGGGDASVLRGLGVPVDRQLAVDMDAVALAGFREKHPDVPTLHGSVTDVRGYFDVVFLDFYCNIESPRLTGWLQHGYRCLARRSGSYFVFAVLYGRESRRFVEIVSRASQEKRRWRAGCREIIEAHLRGADPEAALTPELRRVIENRPLDEWVDQFTASDHFFKSVARIGAEVVRALHPVVVERRLAPEMKFTITYPGLSPMLVQGMSTHEYPSKWSEAKFQKRAVRDSQRRPRDDEPFDRLERPSVQDLLALVEADGFYDRAALLLNMSPGSVAAYRASRTRRQKT